MKKEIDIAAIENAHTQATGNWSECDWNYIETVDVFDGQQTVELSLSTDDELDYSRVGDCTDREAAAYHLTAKHFGLDEDEMDDANGDELGTEQAAIFAGFCELVEKIEDYKEKVAQDAKDAEQSAEMALDAAREGNLAEALRLAKMTENTEGDYGAAPVWRPDAPCRGNYRARDRRSPLQSPLLIQDSFQSRPHFLTRFCNFTCKLYS